MKIVFVSNYFNHHQKPFCEEMYKRLGADFVFVSTTAMREERRKLGYAQDNLPPYVHVSYENPQQQEKAVSFINEADVVIAGSAPDKMLAERIKAGKLLLRYSERPFKIKLSPAKKIYYFIRLRQKDLWKKNVYMLCASAYAATDYTSVGMYRNRTYKWGYFPEVKKYDEEALQSQKKRNTLMWCGRFLDWKHPDDAIRVAHKLKNLGYQFQLNIVGTGVMEEELHTLVKTLELTDCVSFLGSMSPEQVRVHMEKAGIYLFTSDRQEGWGAVLNESMNSGCAVVASQAVGSAPFLIRDGENGLLYRSENVDDLFEKIKFLLDNLKEQERMGRAAYCTMRDTWNATVAADRLLQLIEKLMVRKKHPNLLESGPCSKAEIIKD